MLPAGGREKGSVAEGGRGGTPETAEVGVWKMEAGSKSVASWARREAGPIAIMRAARQARSFRNIANPFKKC
jgi:hypothetical protein